ncbi:hypothetical protein Salat_0210700 [Sesamum alatum]|uniref:Uncharacterized protein n=1 Tax=Sesamum alatum TaxID=300844 RepID=A0AAE1YYR8_9LAMI|nr:hypothetical protein Salat_0210700 [Sesamum alatum]
MKPMVKIYLKRKLFVEDAWSNYDAKVNLLWLIKNVPENGLPLKDFSAISNAKRQSIFRSFLPPSMLRSSADCQPGKIEPDLESGLSGDDLVKWGVETKQILGSKQESFEGDFQLLQPFSTIRLFGLCIGLFRVLCSGFSLFLARIICVG